MAFQLQDFAPLQAKHYQLATTQSELDEAARRQMAINDQNNASQERIASMREANEQSRAAANLGLNQQELAVRAANNQAQVEDQAARTGLAQQTFEANQAQQALENQRYGIKEGRQLEQAGYERNRQQQFDAQLAEDRKEKQDLANKTKLLGELGLYLQTVAPDDKGEVDISSQRDALKQMGIDSGKNSVVKMRNNNGVSELFGVNDKGEYNAIMANDTPVRINNQAFIAAIPFAKESKPDKEVLSIDKDELNATRKQLEATDKEIRKLAVSMQGEIDPDKKALLTQQHSALVQRQIERAQQADALSDRINSSLGRAQQLQSPKMEAKPEPVALSDEEKAMQDVRQSGLSNKPREPVQINPSNKEVTNNSNPENQVKQLLRTSTDIKRVYDAIVPFLNNEDIDGLSQLPADQQGARVLAIRDRLIRHGKI
jgi:hypothetical protein